MLNADQTFVCLEHYGFESNIKRQKLKKRFTRDSICFFILNTTGQY